MGKKVADGLIAGLVRIKCNAGLQSLITEKEANHERMTDDDAPQEGRGILPNPKTTKMWQTAIRQLRTWQDMAGHGSIPFINKKALAYLR